MLRNILFILFCLFGTICFAQEYASFNKEKVQISEIIGKDTIYSIVEEMPFITTVDAKNWSEYINHELIYPKEAIKKGIEGDVVVSFIIDLDGSMRDFSITKSLYSSLDNEAIRILKTMHGMWTAGKHNGKPVKVRCQVSIPFKLSSEIISNEVLIHQFISENIKEGLEFHIEEIEHAGDFDIKELKERYRMPKIIIENTEDNIEIFSEIKEFANHNVIDYYVSVIIGTRFKGTNDPWTPSWYLVFFDVDRNLLEMFYYYP